MLWAAFGSNRHTGLVPLDGDLEAPRKRVTSWVIREVYRGFLPDIMVEGGEFMHDGAGPHRGYIAIDLLRQLDIKVMKRPPYSSDLNPIENLWALVKAEIYILYPELETAPDTEATLDQLVQAAQEAWHAIDIGVLFRLAMTMEHRVKAVIDNDGWYTKY
jgi:transposase